MTPCLCLSHTSHTVPLIIMFLQRKINVHCVPSPPVRRSINCTGQVANTGCTEYRVYCLEHDTIFDIPPFHTAGSCCVPRWTGAESIDVTRFDKALQFVTKHSCCVSHAIHRGSYEPSSSWTHSRNDQSTNTILGTQRTLRKRKQILKRLMSRPANNRRARRPKRAQRWRDG